MSLKIPVIFVDDEQSKNLDKPAIAATKTNIRPKTILFSRNIKKGKRHSQKSFTQYLVCWVNGVVSWETSKMKENYASYSRLLAKFTNLDKQFKHWLDDDFVVRNALTVIEKLRQSLPDTGHLDRFPFNKFVKNYPDNEVQTLSGKSISSTTFFST